MEGNMRKKHRKATKPTKHKQNITIAASQPTNQPFLSDMIAKTRKWHTALHKNIDQAQNHTKYQDNKAITNQSTESTGGMISGNQLSRKREIVKYILIFLIPSVLDHGLHYMLVEKI